MKLTINAISILFCVFTLGCSSTLENYSYSEHTPGNIWEGVLNGMCLHNAKMEAASCVKQGFALDGTASYHGYTCGLSAPGLIRSYEHIRRCQALNNIYNNVILPDFNTADPLLNAPNLLRYRFPNCGANFIDDLYGCQFDGRLDDMNRAAINYPDVSSSCYHTEGIERTLCLCKKYEQDCHVILGL